MGVGLDLVVPLRDESESEKERKKERKNESKNDRNVVAVLTCRGMRRKCHLDIQ
jgi:hypothetical protein